MKKRWVLCLMVATLFFTAAKIYAVSNPAVTGPIPATALPGDPSRNYPFFASQFDLAARGYVEEEYFIEGTANRYTIVPQTTATVRDGGHPYKTRILVRRPISPLRFSGTVLVEWINVTNGLDMENTWFQIYDYVLRSGHAWVGVSAQRVGVHGNVTPSNPLNKGLRAWNPARYGTLDLSNGGMFTSDALDYDVFSQAVQAIRYPAGVNPLGGLAARTIIATGHSQSAVKLATYVNSIQPLARVIDAFALHGTYGTNVRPDNEVPVWKALSESDVVNFGEYRYRRADSDNFRTWEVPGTSHNDRQSYASRFFLQHRDLGVAVEDVLNCDHMPAGSGVPFHYAMAAGLEYLIRWVRDGVPMPSAPRIEIDTARTPVDAVRDVFGIAVGGIRLSQVEVPVAISTGRNSGFPSTCDRWGYTEPFGDSLLQSLYSNHGRYVSRVSNVTLENMFKGHILPEDAETTISTAARSSVGQKK